MTKRTLNALIERVLKRVAEANIGTIGTSPTVRAPDPNAPTQFPGQDNDKPTVPAAKSKAQQAADAEWSGMNTRNPKAPPPTQKSIKVNSIKKALDKMGYTSTPEKAQHVTSTLNGWYDKIDPGDALVSTADDLAKRFASGG